MLMVNDNGVKHRGTVQVTMPRSIDVTIAEPDLQQWAQQQLAMMAGIEVIVPSIRRMASIC